MRYTKQMPCICFSLTKLPVSCVIRSVN